MKKVNFTKQNGVGTSVRKKIPPGLFESISSPKTYYIKKDLEDPMIHVANLDN